MTARALARRVGMVGLLAGASLFYGCSDASEAPAHSAQYDTTPVARDNCPPVPIDKCVAVFGDPSSAGKPSNDDPQAPQIKNFAPAAYYGDAPFTTDIAFEVVSPSGADLRCELDSEGDGVFDQKIACSAGTVSVTYPIPGRYSPALRVTDSEGRANAVSEILLSNRLVPKPETVALDELPGLEDSGVDGDVVTLRFGSEQQVPDLAVGAVLQNRTAEGYVRKALTVTRSGATLEVETEELSVFDAYESGFFGMRYPIAEALDATDSTALQTQWSPGMSPKDLPGDFSFGPSTTSVHVPFPANVKVGLPGGLEFALENPSLDLKYQIQIFEISVLARYAFIYANSEIRFDTDASITGTVDLPDESVFIPIGPLGVGYSTPWGKLALGAVIEAGVNTDLNLSVGWHQSVVNLMNVNVLQTDPVGIEFPWDSYPDNVAELNGSTTLEFSDGHVEVELEGKLFAAPQVVLSFGNAAGVMQRAKKDEVKYQAECKKFKGIRAAAGLEANVSFTASVEDATGNPALCLRVGREAKLFAELFPGFDYCPSVEYPLLDDAQQDWWHQCWCKAAVDDVVVSPGKHVGEIVTIDVQGACFKPEMTEDGITVQVPGCGGLVSTAYADTAVSYQCVPSVAGDLPGTVLDKDGATLFNFVVPILSSEPLDAGPDGSTDADVDAGPDATADASLDVTADALGDACTCDDSGLPCSCGPDAGPDVGGPDGLPPGDSGIVYGTPGQSCNGMLGTECQGNSCCSNILVPGGTFPMGRSVSGTDACPSGMSCYPQDQPEHDATVSDFYLDEYEVTVGRFRKFVEQFDGTPPPDGAAAHPVIAGTGWQSAWNTSLAASQAALMTNLKCSSSYQTWTDAAVGNEHYAINCVSWYEAFAFCAWDGGRLPTEAEWEYAAAGGDANRLYPWGSEDPNVNTALANFYNNGSPFINVGSHPLGAARWGHHDLAGGMYEWAFDWWDESWYSGAGNTCNNCANTTGASNRVFRGGYFGSSDDPLRAAYRDAYDPADGYYYVGFRCAR